MTSSTLERFIQSGDYGWELTEDEFNELRDEDTDYDILLVVRQRRYYLIDRTLLRVKVIKL